MTENSSAEHHGHALGRPAHPAVWTGLYTGSLLVIVMVGALVAANRIPGLERYALERNASSYSLFVIFMLIPVCRFLNRPIQMFSAGIIGWTMFAAAYGALNLAYFLLAFAGLRTWRRRNWAGAGELAFAMAASVVLRCALLLTLDNSEPRYTLEFFPVLFVWAGALFAVGFKLGRPGIRLVQGNIGILVLNLIITFTVPGISR